MSRMTPHRRAIHEQVEVTTERLLKHVRDEEPLAVVQAPPGSGKTHLLMRAVKEAYRGHQRIAIATQTRSQADDICRRLFTDFDLPVIRFVASGAFQDNLPKGVQQIARHQDLPAERCIVVGTTAKWGLIDLHAPFDVVFVEEAWQMAWADFMLLGQVAARFVLIGDPGQIPPVVSVDASRWETAPRAPHRPAPELILREHGEGLLNLQLPATRRLPSCTKDLIRPFYDFTFDAWAEPGGRQLVCGRRGHGRIGSAIQRLCTGSVVAVTLPTPAGGPPLECDEEVAGLAVDMVQAILETQPDCLMDGDRRPLTAEDIGMCATHHVMNAAMAMRKNRKLKDVGIDTPERWQGLEKRVMVVVHPLSGVAQPSDFDLETGRLCVMASRHQISLVIVARDHLATTLEGHLPAAGQPVGRPDVAGRGHHQNLTFWTSLLTQDRIIPAGPV